MGANVTNATTPRCLHLHQAGSDLQVRSNVGMLGGAGATCHGTAALPASLVHHQLLNTLHCTHSNECNAAYTELKLARTALTPAMLHLKPYLPCKICTF